MRILLLATVLVGLLVGLPLACNTTPRAQATERSGFTGTYSLVSIDGHPVPYTPMHEGQQAPEVVSGTLTLNSDGTFTSAMSYRLPDGRVMSRDFRGTYSGKGSKLNLQWEGAGQTKAEVEGSTFTYDNHGMLFVHELLVVARPDLELAAEQAVPILDLKPALLEIQAREEAYLTGDAHWNEAGHRAVARSLVPMLLDPEPIYAR